MNKVENLLKAFVSGSDRSVEWAKATEAAMDDENMDEDPRYDELSDHLASYRPGGGDFLYGENEMLRVCRTALDLIIHE